MFFLVSAMSSNSRPSAKVFKSSAKPLLIPNGTMPVEISPSFNSFAMQCPLPLSLSLDITNGLRAGIKAEASQDIPVQFPTGSESLDRHIQGHTNLLVLRGSMDLTHPRHRRYFILSKLAIAGSLLSQFIPILRYKKGIPIYE